MRTRPGGRDAHPRLRSRRRGRDAVSRHRAGSVSAHRRRLKLFHRSREKCVPLDAAAAQPHNHARGRGEASSTERHRLNARFEPAHRDARVHNRRARARVAERGGFRVRRRQSASSSRGGE